MGSSTDDIFNALGVLGGVILALSLLPQIYLAHKRRSAKDISYIWQGIYITGLLTLMAYFGYFELWPVFYPMAFELTCIFYLTGLKIYYEVIAPIAAAPTDDIADLEANGSDRVGRSAAVQAELKASLSLDGDSGIAEAELTPSTSLEGGNGVAVDSSAGIPGKNAGGEGADRAGAEQA